MEDLNPILPITQSPPKFAKIFPINFIPISSITTTNYHNSIINNPEIESTQTTKNYRIFKEFTKEIEINQNITHKLTPIPTLKTTTQKQWKG